MLLTSVRQAIRDSFRAWVREQLPPDQIVCLMEIIEGLESAEKYLNLKRRSPENDPRALRRGPWLVNPDTGK